MEAFDLLHPALRHHIVNSLGWRTLRPLQSEAIGPLIRGEHGILLAPTAGGKTEAAMFPVFSRMLTEDWRGLSVLYLCPIKALLNNLEPRLAGYAGLLGRRVALWHGDVSETARKRIEADPPDILLTTPESMEVILVSSRRNEKTFFGNLRVVVIDEMHAFAGDDRGWHLLAVVERAQKVAGREVQRIGLSATVGNPEQLLKWLAGRQSSPRHVVAPEISGGGAKADLTLDSVASIEQAATLISRLHRGEKRLVFCDSRSRVEKLGVALRGKEVQTFISHSSLSLDQRRQAEQAFVEARDCVIVATSTLELGIDVGDLDRVIQIDAPASVASFLQRLGRTGRRPGTTRNCLFIATTEEALVHAAGLLELHAAGYVEPVEPPSHPAHLYGHQLMTLSLQEKGLGRTRIDEWLGNMPGFAELEDRERRAILDHMLATELLFEDGGRLSLGPEGERLYGRKNFLELFAVFSTPPLFKVLHGRIELGEVHQRSFQAAKEHQTPVLALGGRSWQVTHLDWPRRVAYVQPTEERGRSQWLGRGQSLSFALCQAIRRVLTTGTCPVTLTRRATAALADVVDLYSWLPSVGTVVVRQGADRLTWHTFAGSLTNALIAERIPDLLDSVRSATNFTLALHPRLTQQDLQPRLDALRADLVPPLLPITQDAIEDLKFHEALPPGLAATVLRERLTDASAYREVLGQRVNFVDFGPPQ